LSNRLRKEMFRYHSVCVARIAFQACSFNHSDISPSLESTIYGHSPVRIVSDCDKSSTGDGLRSLNQVYLSRTRAGRISRGRERPSVATWRLSGVRVEKSRLESPPRDCRRRVRRLRPSAGLSCAKRCHVRVCSDWACGTNVANRLVTSRRDERHEIVTVTLSKTVALRILPA
jgi:hypothetical protein